MIMTVPVHQHDEWTSNSHMGHYNDNQICQWYCCSCGQSYGSIICKDVGVETESNLQNNESITSTYKTLNDYLLQSLKHYSQMIYSHYQDNDDGPSTMHHVEPNATESSSAHTSSTVDAQAQAGPTRSQAQESVFQNHDKNYTTDNIEPPSRAFTTTPLSDENASLNHSVSPKSNLTPHRNDSNILLQVPTRFTCHRCDHMMCPYCPKVRYKDLAKN